MLDARWTKRLIECATCLLWSSESTEVHVGPHAILDRGGLRLPCGEAERLMLLGVVADVRQKLLDQRKALSAPLADVLRYIRTHSRDPRLSRASVAKVHGHSISWMSHTFRKEVGASFVQYLSSVRLTDGEDLLRSSSRSIKEIGLTVGFESTASFPRLFRKRHRQTPTQWRRTQAAGPTAEDHE